MTRTIKTFVIATGLLSVSGVFGAALPAKADPPSHAPAWGNRRKQDDKKYVQWQRRDDNRDRRDDRRNDGRDRDRRDDRKDDWRDRNRDKNWNRDNNNSSWNRTRDTDHDGIRDVLDRFPKDRRHH